MNDRAKILSDRCKRRSQLLTPSDYLSIWVYFEPSSARLAINFIKRKADNRTLDIASVYLASRNNLYQCHRAVDTNPPTGASTKPIQSSLF